MVKPFKPISKCHVQNGCRPSLLARSKPEVLEVEALEPRKSLRAIAAALRRITKNVEASNSSWRAGSRILIHAQPDILNAAEGAGLVNGLAFCLSEEAVDWIDSKCTTNTLGNEQGIRIWQGNVSTIPAYQGPFDIAVVGDIDSLGKDLRAALLPVSLLMKPGGYILLSNSRDSSQSDGASGKGREFLEQIIYDLPLRIDAFGGSGASWISILQVPRAYTFSRAPIFAEEVVVTGFGRGSKQMGVPTANLKPDSLFSGPLHNLPLGVYFGWAQVDTEERAVCKTVLNIGRRPSIDDGEQNTVELHILHTFTSDFYGKSVKVIMTGFIRPEMRFSGLPELIDRINADKGIAKSQLDAPVHAEFKSADFFGSR